MRRILALLTVAVLTSPCHGALIHRYDFSTDASDSVGGAHGTLLNGASVSGGILNLDGVNDYVQIGSHIVPTTGSYTVSLFARQDSPQTTYVELISQGMTAGTGFYIGHNLSHDIRAGDPWQLTGIPFPSDGQFHHFALVVDAPGNNSHLYVDGLLQASLGSALTTGAGGSDTRLGRQFAPFNEFLHGALDDVRVYDTALADNQIAALATVPIPAALWLFSTGLIGFVGMVRRNTA